MKEVKAFVRPEKVGQIVPVLKEAGFKNISLTSGEGTGQQMGRPTMADFYTVRQRWTTPHIDVDFNPRRIFNLPGCCLPSPEVTSHTRLSTRFLMRNQEQCTGVPIGTPGRLHHQSHLLRQIVNLTIFAFCYLESAL